MLAVERLIATRIVATPGALDAATWPVNAITLRTAADEVIVLAEIHAGVIADPHAIVSRDTSLFGVWLGRVSAVDLLARHCDWELPHAPRAFAQGAVAGLPLKVWFDDESVLFVVAAPFVADFVERCR